MLSAILMVKFLLCLLFLCLCNAVPAGKKPYTKEEENLIIEEMLKYSVDIDKIPIYGSDLWKKITQSHRNILELNPHAFPTARTLLGLSRYFQEKMLLGKGKVKLPVALTQKLPASRKGKESKEQSNYVPGKHSGKKTIKPPGIRYTSTEDKLLMDEVLNYPQRPIRIRGPKMWKVIEEHFKEKRITNANPREFPKERTAEGLKQRFRYIMDVKVEGQEREKLIKEIHSTEKGKYAHTVELTYSSVGFTREEDAFIIAELFKVTHFAVFKWSVWREMEETHDRIRLMDTAGFHHKRTAAGLRSRFQVIKQKGSSVPRALMEKFPIQFADLLRAATQRASGSLQGETSADGSDLVSSMIEELLNTPDEVNFNVMEETIESENEIWASMIEELQDDPAQVYFPEI